MFSLVVTANKLAENTCLLDFSHSVFRLHVTGSVMLLSSSTWNSPEIWSLLYNGHYLELFGVFMSGSFTLCVL